VDADKQVLPAEVTGRVERLIAHKYRADLVVIRPIRWLQAALRLGRNAGSPVTLAITSRR
jgi:hypothetical protein